MEEFRVIKGFENYSVSNLGNVKNNSTGRILKPEIRSRYYSINVWKNGNNKKCKIHRLVAEAFLNNPDNKPLIDHIDNNPLNNNINNLRFCSHQENSFNTKLSKNNSSGYKGVSFDIKYKQWKSYIIFNGKQIHLGNFNTKEEAIKARVKKAKELFGEYMNQCEEIKEDIKIIKDEKQKELEELEALEKEFEELIKTRK